MRILIIEDEVRVGNLLAESIQLQGHEAILASSGPEGLALIEQRGPDAVFLDLVMPQMSGLEVLRQMQATPPALPVIVITGHASAAQIEEAKRLGAIDCVVKPFVLNRLNQALGKLLKDQEGR